MLKLILVDLKRNKNNSFKLVFLLFIIITIISFYFASINSLNNTVKCEEKKLIYDNYYQVIDDDFNADIILKNIEYEKKEYSYREDNFRIEFVNSNYSMFVRENIKILNLKDKDYLMPKIVKSSYEANNINELYIGFLPNNINEVCIPYSYYINISSNTNFEVSLDEIIGLEINIISDSLSFMNMKIVGVSNSSFFDIYDNFIINTKTSFEENNHLTRYYINSFSKKEIIDSNIKNNGLETKIFYCGNQYGFYDNVIKIKNFFMSTYLIIAVPFSLSIIALLIHESLFFYESKSNVFNQIMLLGGKRKNISLMVNFEIFLLSIISMILSIFSDIVLMQVFKILGENLFIEIHINILDLLNIQIILTIILYIYSIIIGLVICKNAEPDFKNYEK